MTLLLIGLALFFGAHLVPSTPLRAVLIGALGEKGYKGLFTLASIGGLVIAVIGYRQVPVEYLFAPKPWAYPAALHTMPIVFILLASASSPTHIRQWVRHPMALGVLLWSLLHYFANGEKAAVWFFGSFAIYAAFSIVSSSLRGQTLVKPGQVVAWKHDVIAVVAGLVLYGVVLVAHGWLFNRVLVSL
jgi:uncharacterized membrane protein